MGVNAILNKYRAASPEEEPSGVDSILEKYKAAARRPSPQPLRGEIHFGSQDEVRPFKPELPAALKGFENKLAPGVKKSAIPSFLQPTDTLKQPKKKAPGTFSTIVNDALKEKRQGDAEIAKQAQYRRNQAREAYSKGDWKTAKRLDPEGLYPIPENQQEREFATEGGKILPGRGIELEGQGDAYRKVFRGAQKTVGGIATALAPASVAGMTKAQKEKVAIGAGQLAGIQDDVEGNLLNAGLAAAAGPVLGVAAKGLRSWLKLFNFDQVSKGISPSDVVKLMVKHGVSQDDAVQFIGKAIRESNAESFDDVVRSIWNAESKNTPKPTFTFRADNNYDPGETPDLVGMAQGREPSSLKTTAKTAPTNEVERMVYVGEATQEAADMLAAAKRTFGVSSVDDVHTNYLNLVYDTVAAKYGISAGEISGKAINRVRNLEANNATDLLEEAAARGKSPFDEAIRATNEITEQKRTAEYDAIFKRLTDQGYTPEQAAAALEAEGIRKGANPKPTNEPGVAELAGKGRVVKDVQKEPWQMKPSDYEAAINQNGKAIADQDRPNLQLGDLDGVMSKRKFVSSFKTSDGEVISIYADDEGMAAFRSPQPYGENEVVGYIKPLSDNEIDLSVVEQYQRKGIGSELQYQFRLLNPFFQSGGLTTTGRASLRRTHSRMVEQALREGKPVPAEVLADYPDLAAKYVKSAPEAVPTPLPVDDVRPVQIDSNVKGSVGEAKGNAQTGAKEPWQMTREEFTRPSGMSLSAYDTLINRKEPSWRQDDFNKAEAYHKWAVIEPALQEGKPVPAEVLRDYPDLAAKYNVSAPSPTTSRYGANYGTPVQASGKRPGYAMERPAVKTPTEPPPVKPVEPKTVAKAGPSPEVTSVSNRGFEENPNIDAPKGQGQSAKKLIDDADIDAEGALDLSRRIQDGSAAFNPENAAKVQTGVAKLQRKVNEYADLMDEADAKGDAAGYQRYREQYEAARSNLQEFAENVQKGKSEWSDVGRILAAGVDENGDFAAMQQSYARAKGVKVEKLTQKETAMLKGFADEYNRMTKEIEDLKAQVNGQRAADAVERGRRSRRTVDPEALKARKAEAAKAISEEVQKILTAPVAGILGAGGPGGGAVNFGRLGKAIRDYADVLVTEGVQGLDNVVQAIREAFPVLERQQIVNMLAESEKRTKGELEAALTKARNELKREAKKASDVGQGKQADKAARTMEAKRKADAARKAKQDAIEADRLEREGKRAEAKKLRDDMRQRAKEQDELDREAKRLDEAAAREQQKPFNRETELRGQISELERKIAEGDFAVKSKPEMVKSKQVERLEAERDLVRKKYEHMRAQAKKNESTAYKVTKTVGDTIRGSQLGFDLGAMLRQGFFGITHPVKMTKAIADGFKSMRSDVALEVIQRRINGGEINGKPASAIRSRSGLYIADTLSAPEETFAGNLIEKIPGLGQVYKAGERFTTGFLNTYRVEMFDWFAKRFPNATDEELKNWAKWINSTSGRSNLKEVPPVMGLLLTSPRYAASRFEVIGRIVRSPFTAIKDKAERRVFIEAVKTGSTVLGAIKMAEAAGAEVNFDYTSSDFLKIRVGDTVYDPTAGIGGSARLLLRTLAPLVTGKPGGWGKNVTDEVGKFAVGKVSPAVSSAYEIRTDKSLTGFDLPEDEKGWNALLPVIVAQLKENIKKDGYLKGTIKTTPELVGIGSNTYPKK